MYTCKAVNALGEAVTFTTVHATGRSELDLGTKHPKGVEGFRAIASFEAKGSLEDGPEEAVEDGAAPRFVVDFKDVVVAEATGSAYFEAQLEPRGDSRMLLDWTLNGKPLQESESNNIFCQILGSSTSLPVIMTNSTDYLLR